MNEDLLVVLAAEIIYISFRFIIYIYNLFNEVIVKKNINIDVNLFTNTSGRDLLFSNSIK